MINDLSYKGFDFITNLGIKNNLNINLKNLNSLGKKMPNINQVHN